MAYFRKNKGAQKAPKKMRRVGRKKTYAKKTSMVKAVKQVLSRQAETKRKIVAIAPAASAIYGGGLGNFGTAIGYHVPNVLSSIALAQGTEQEERIGNSVSSAKLSLRGLITTLPISATNPYTSPYELHMVVFKKKNDPTGDTSNILSLPGNITAAVDGSVIRTIYPFNKDAYTIYAHKVFHMNPRDYVAAPSIGNNENRAVNYRRFNVSVPIKDKLLFPDNVSAPSNDWCSVGFYYINGDGSTTIAAATRSALWLEASLTYKDL